ncbi:unnamed protein product [Paramecium sonneborni]|uniref:Regulator of chromosome condensation 1/beta-lactamase-inhibitor protein II n=1 Tax=Paramecium sonneborni TaxID=65129 RepID=A0A8S1NJB0_9CILI|nr:unnamed protein product [Paramecium sonneborni]
MANKVGATQIYETQPMKFYDENADNNSILAPYNLCPKGVYILNMCTTITNSFLLSTSGQVYSWGNNCEELGRTCATQAEASRPALVSFQTKIMQICSGNNHILALDVNGVVYSWGRNEAGQLGQNDLDPVALPKEVEFFKKSPVVQIYAGGDSSYAITKKGSLFAWGDNSNNQLGLGEGDHSSPQQVIQTPWDNAREVKIVYGKNNLGYLFNIDNITKEQENQIVNMQLKEAQEEIMKLQQKLNEQNSLSAKQPVIVEKTLGEDQLLKNIQTQIQSATGQSNSQENTLKQTEEEILQLEKDLQSIKQQLFDIFAKENELNNQREEVDMQVRKLERSDQGKSAEHELKIKEQKRIKELFQANDNIKNNLLKRQNQSEETKLRKQEELGKQREKAKDLQNLISLLKIVETDRKITLKKKFLEQNKVDLEKFMEKITHFFREMCDCNIAEIAKKTNQLSGMANIIKQSNEKLSYIKNELLGFKINSSDESYEILSKILDILQDNLNLRKKLNDYMVGVIMMSEEKTQQPIKVQEIQNQQQKKLQQFIEKQQKELQEIGRLQIDGRKYKAQVQSINNMKLKQRDFCFGLI